MRRIVPTLLALALGLTLFTLAGCQAGPAFQGVQEMPSYVVSEHCYPIDINGNPLHRDR